MPHPMFFSARILSCCLVTFYSACAFSQFESEPASVALDNTTVQCFGDEFSPATDSFTKGGSSMRSFPDRTVNRSSFAGCFVEGGETITFDWRYTSGESGDSFGLEAFGEFGRRYVLATLDATTNWVTTTVTLPNDVDSFNWHFDNYNAQGDAWVDNLRIRGDQSDPPKPPGGEFDDNPLSVAVDNTDYNFETTGDSLFFVQSQFKSIGPTAVQSGNISDGQISFFFTFVEGGEPISFDWKVSSELGYDGLIFYYLDSGGRPIGDIVTSISGESDWLNIESEVPGQGLRFVVWAYIKDEFVSDGRDTGWIDNIRVGKEKIFMPPIINLLLQE